MSRDVIALQHYHSSTWQTLRHMPQGFFVDGLKDRCGGPSYQRAGDAGRPALGAADKTAKSRRNS
jgi:surface antigen